MTAIKTISARIRGSKTDLDSLGEEIGDLADGFSKYAEELKAITGFDIRVEGTTDQYKDLYDIFDGISKVWDKLSDAQQARVSEILGGTRQLTVISSIIGNWKDAVAGYETAMNSAGAATRANDIYMETAAAHIAQFKAEFQSLSSTLVSSDLISTIVDFGTGIMKVVDALARAGALIPTVLALATAIGTLKAAKATFGSVSAAMTELSAAFKSGAWLFPGGMSEFTGLISPLGKVALAIAAITAAIAIFKPMIEDLTKSVDDRISETADKIKEIQKTAEDSAKSYRDLKASADEVIPRFGELAQGVDRFGQKTSKLSTEEYEEFLQLNNQVAQMFPQLVAGYDSNGNAMLNLSYGADSLTDSLWSLVEAEQAAANAEIAAQFPEMVSQVSTQVDNYKTKVEQFKDDLGDVNSAIDKFAKEEDIVLRTTNAFGGTISQVGDGHLIDRLKALGIKLQQRVGGQEYSDGTFENVETYLDYSSLTDDQRAKVQNVLNDYVAGIEREIQNTNTQMESVWEELRPFAMSWLQTDGAFDGLDDLRKRIATELTKDLDFEAIIEANPGMDASAAIQAHISNNILSPLENARDEVKDAFASLLDLKDLYGKGEISFDEFAEGVRTAFESAFSSLEDPTELISWMNQLGYAGTNASAIINSIVSEFAQAAEAMRNSTANVFESMSDQIDAAQDSMTKLSTAFENLRSGSLDITDVVDLVQEFPDLIKYVDLTEDGFGNLDQGLRNLYTQNVEQLVDQLQQFKETNNLIGDSAQAVDDLCAALGEIPIGTTAGLSEEFGRLASQISSSNAELAKLDEQLKEPDYDNNYNKRVANFTKFQELLDSGKVGSREYKGYAQSFGLEGESPEDIRAWADSVSQYFAEGTDGLEAFLNKVRELNKSGGLDESIASWNGEDFLYDYNRLDELAKALGLNENTTNDIIQAVRAYSENWHQDIYDIQQELVEAGELTFDEDSGKFVGSIDEIARYTGKTKEEVKELFDELNGPIPTIKELRQEAELLDIPMEELLDQYQKFNLISDDALKKFDGFSDPLERTTNEIENANNALSDFGLDVDDVSTLEGFDSALAPMLEQLGWAETEIDALRQKLVAPIDIQINAESTIADIAAQFENLKISLPEIDGSFTVTTDTVREMMEKGFSKERIQEVVNQMGEIGFTISPDVQLDDTALENLQADVAAELAGEETEGNVTVSVDLQVAGQEELAASIQTTVSELTNLVGDNWTVVLSAENGDANSKIEATKSLLNTVEDKDVTITSNTGGAEASIASLQAMLNSLTDKTINVTVNRRTVGNSSDLAKNAKGTRHAKRGPSLLGDEYSPNGQPKPELVVSGDQAYLAGVNGPVVGMLEEGDVVYNADDTKRILGGKRRIKSIPAFATGGRVSFGGGGSSSGGTGSGTVVAGNNVTINNEVNNDITVNGDLNSEGDIVTPGAHTTSNSFGFTTDTPNNGMNGGGGGGGGRSGGSGGSGSSKEETWFDKQYKEHQHLVAMDRETDEEYLNWLEKAYQKAYKERIIEIDDFYKYEEEVYEGRKRLFEDFITDIEHKIQLEEYHKAQKRNINQIIAYYEQLMEAVHQQAEAARAMGLTDDDEYIQELQNKWWEYHNAIAEARSEWFNELLDDQKFVIERMNDLDADSVKIANSWRDVMGSIEKELKWYLDRGYDMTDEVVQDLMQELWSARDEIIEIANASVDGIQNVYKTFTDAAKEWATTGFLSVDSLQAILELGPKYLQFLYDENGQLKVNEQSLQKVLAARTEEMAAETALAYVKRILVAAEAGDIETLTALTKVATDATGATWGLVYATLGLAREIGTANGVSEDFFDNALDYIDKIHSLSITTISTIGDSYETLNDWYISQADALDKLIDYTKELLKWENQQRIQALKDQLEAYKKIIDAKKESLRLSREQDDHDKSVAEKLEEIAKLQARIDLLALDDSREARAERAKLEEELAKKQGDLADEQAKYAYDQQVDALDREYDAFEEEKNAEIEVLENLYSSEEKLFQAAIDRIQNGWGDLYQQLIAWNTEYGSHLNKEITAAWNSASDAVQRYGDFLGALIGTDSHVDLGPSTHNKDIATQLYENSVAWYTASPAEQDRLHNENAALAERWKQETGHSLSYSNGVWYSDDGAALYSLDKQQIAESIVAAMKRNAAAWHSADGITKQYLSDLNILLGQRLARLLDADIHRDGNGTWWIGNKKLFDVYHTGGIAGSAPTLKQNEVLAVLEKGEAILDKRREEGLYKVVDFIQVLSDRLGKAINPSVLNQISGQYPMLPQLSAPSVGNSVNESYVFSPTIQVAISHSGSMTEADAKRYGNSIADVALSKLKDAFTRRGVNRVGDALLKQ